MASGLLSVVGQIAKSPQSSDQFGALSPYIVTGPKIPNQSGRTADIRDAITQLLIGFQGLNNNNTRLHKAVSLVMGRSNGDPGHDVVQADGSHDRGIWALNNKTYPWVSDQCAFNPTCSTKAVEKITNGFTDFHAFSGSPITSAKHDVASADSGFLGTGIGSPVGGGIDVGGAIAALVKLVGLLFDRATWISVAKTIFGIFLVGWAIYALAKSAGVPVPKPRIPVPVPIP